MKFRDSVWFWIIFFVAFSRCTCDRFYCRSFHFEVLVRENDQSEPQKGQLKMCSSLAIAKIAVRMLRALQPARDEVQICPHQQTRLLDSFAIANWNRRTPELAAATIAEGEDGDALFWNQRAANA